MTFCNLLGSKRTERGGVAYHITAYEEFDKFSAVPRYSVYVSHSDDCIVFETWKASKTTWKKRFAQVCGYYSD